MRLRRSDWRIVAQVYRVVPPCAGCLMSSYGIKWHDMSAIAHEVASQPDIWRRAADLAPDLPLPARGLRIAVAGCGTSLYMAQSYAVAREQAGAGGTDAVAPSQVPTGRRFDPPPRVSRPRP